MKQAQICAEGCQGGHHLVHIGIIWQNIFNCPIWPSGSSADCVLHYYSMSFGKCQKLDAPYTNLKVFIVAMKHGIFFLKLGHDGIWSIKFVDPISIFQQRLPQNISKIEKLENTL